MSPTARPGFPPWPGAAPPTPAEVLGLGCRLRALTDADSDWLRALYASTREQELAAVPWPAAARQAFLAQQFELQHRHFISHYGQAEFLAIEHHADGPVGRYYLQRQPPDHLIVDIALFPRWRSQGLGRALIHASQQDAAARGCGMQLHVAAHNPAAQRLYERLGFVATGEGGSHRHMRWMPPPGCRPPFS